MTTIFSRLNSLICISVLVLTQSPPIYANERSLLETFNEYNKCETEKCARRYLDGTILEQLNSIKDVSKKDEVIKASKLSEFKSEVKTKGNYGALYVSDYRFVYRPQVKGGVTMVYLFSNSNGVWKIYHRLTPKDIDADLKPHH